MNVPTGGKQKNGAVGGPHAMIFKFSRVLYRNGRFRIVFQHRRKGKSINVENLEKPRRTKVSRSLGNVALVRFVPLGRH